MAEFRVLVTGSADGIVKAAVAALAAEGAEPEGTGAALEDGRRSDRSWQQQSARQLKPAPFFLFRLLVEKKWKYFRSFKYYLRRKEILSGSVAGMSELEKSPLVRLVLVIFCLAIAGSMVALVHYYAVDLPSQYSLQPPENTLCHTELCRFCNACWNVCMAKTTFEWNACFDECDTHGCHFNDD